MTDTGPNEQTQPFPKDELSRPDELLPITRHLSWYLTPLLYRTPLTPNHITALSMLFGLAGAFSFTVGSWTSGVVGGLLLTVCYTLDNCDGEIARLKNLVSPGGARFDDVVDWLVDAAFFSGLGVGTYQASGEIIWLWLGLAATIGATIDFTIDLYFEAKATASDDQFAVDESPAPTEKPSGFLGWLVFAFHKLSRADFCVIVLGLALADISWVLLPLAAIGAQVYWVIDLYKHLRGWNN